MCRAMAPIAWAAAARALVFALADVALLHLIVRVFKRSRIVSCLP